MLYFQLHPAKKTVRGEGSLCNYGPKATTTRNSCGRFEMGSTSHLRYWPTYCTERRSEGSCRLRLEPKSTARVLIAAFQGVALQQTWDDKVDARVCFRAMQQLLRLAKTHD